MVVRSFDRDRLDVCAWEQIVPRTVSKSKKRRNDCKRSIEMASDPGSIGGWRKK